MHTHHLSLSGNLAGQRLCGAPRTEPAEHYSTWSGNRANICAACLAELDATDDDDTQPMAVAAKVAVLRADSARR